MAILPILSDTRPPRNQAEAACFRHLKAQGWTVCRRGWPDFIAIKDDRIIAVEVKADARDGLRREQMFVLEWLAAAGLEVYVWNAEERLPRRWRNP